MIITIDGLAMKKKEDFYQNIKEELDVPEYFGAARHFTDEVSSL